MCQPSSCHTQSNLYFFFLIYKPVKNHHQGKKVTNEFTWGCSPLEDEFMEKSLSSEYFCKEGCLFPIQNRHVTRALQPEFGVSVNAFNLRGLGHCTKQ